jgi:aryl-alcohol dehydrogenase-like predicted oxidoreductase
MPLMVGWIFTFTDGRQNSMMPTVAFGRTGLQVSRLGFGGGPIGYLQTDHDRVATILNLMLDAGVNLIDTAAAYEGSEAVIGAAIGHRRSEYVLVSKCGRKLPDLDGEDWSASLIQRTVDRTLRRLRTDHLDVMLLHSCDLKTLQSGEALGALMDARQAGKIRWAGYSGDNDAAAWAAAHPDVAVVQTSINICDQANIVALLPIASEHKVGVLAKRPVANAAWKDIAAQPGLYRGYAQTYTDRFRQMNLKLSELESPAESGQTWPAIALRFTLSQPGLHTALVGTTDPDNARANIAAAERGQLRPAVVERIRDAFRQAERASGTSWLGQT